MRGNRREFFLMAVLLTAAVLLLDILYYPFTLEDAFITFRYAEHLAEGYGLGAWNTDGAIVEGYSSPLWLWLLAACHAAGINVLTAAKLMGILSHLALCLFVLAFPYSGSPLPSGTASLLGRHRDVFVFSAFTLGINLPTAWYAASGMESLSFMLLLTLCLLGPFLYDNAYLPAISGVLLVLIRPEGILFALGCVLLHYLVATQGSGNKRAVYWLLGAAFFSYLALTVFRLAVFGEWLPNTYYAKAGGGGWHHVVLGLKYMQRWLASHLLLVFVLLVALGALMLDLRKLGWRANIPLIFIFAFSALYVVYIVKVGGDDYTAFPYWRHMLHLMPLLALAAGAGLVYIMPASRGFRLGLMVFMLLVVNGKNVLIRNEQLLNDTRALAADFPSLTNAPFNPYYTWLRDMTDSGTLIASSFGGELPYVVDARHIDVLGLNDHHIAHKGRFDPAGPVDAKTDMDYVLRRRPDIIEGYLSVRKIRACRPRAEIVDYRVQMSTGMLDNPLFRRDYLYLRNGPYEHIDRALFLHRDYWTRHPRREELDCVPVLETCLYGSDAESGRRDGHK